MYTKEEIEKEFKRFEKESNYAKENCTCYSGEEGESTCIHHEYLDNSIYSMISATNKAIENFDKYKKSEIKQEWDKVEKKYKYVLKFS